VHFSPDKLMIPSESAPQKLSKWMVMSVCLDNLKMFRQS
jgi:hypothetical protein